MTYMYVVEKYCCDTAATTGAAGFTINVAAVTQDDVSKYTFLTDTSNYIITIILVAESNTSQINIIMETMMNQQIPQPPPTTTPNQNNNGRSRRQHT